MRLGFRHWLAGSPRQQAESSLRRLTEVNLYCGLDVHLRLLSTSPRGDAVTIDYAGPDVPRRGLSPRQCNNITGALAAGFSLRRTSRRRLKPAATRGLQTPITTAIESVVRRRLPRLRSRATRFTCSC